MRYVLCNSNFNLFTAYKGAGELEDPLKILKHKLNVQSVSSSLSLEMFVTISGVDKLEVQHVQLCSKRMGRRQIISSRFTTLRMLIS